MEKAKVYYTDFRTVAFGDGLPTKLKKLIKKAGIGQMDMDGKFVAIKMHFGELGNISFLRPNYARAVVDVVKELGGKPFLTDCNTMYPGSRKNALEHLYCAWENGFTPLTVGCPVIIGDGLKGTDDIGVPVEGGEYVKEARIGRAIMDADVFISLTHFKGHETTGFGGTIKNIGMGCGSRAGKTEQHSNGKPSIDEDVCRGCRRCQRECANGGLVFDEETRKMRVDHAHCVGCGRCLGACNFDAISFDECNANELLNCAHGRIHEGGRGRPPELPHLADRGRIPELRLPLRERRADSAEYRHVRVLRSAGAGSGVRGRLHGGKPDAEQPAFRQHEEAGFRRLGRPVPQLQAGIRMAQLP